MSTLPAFSAFVRAVELGSLSAVAREENVSQPTISKRISALEQSLGVRLLERNTTRLSPTEQGLRLYDRIKRLVDDHDELVADARTLDEQVAGHVRISAPVGLGEVWLNDVLVECQARYPRIDIELVLDDRMADLVDERVDLALRLGGHLPQDGIARKVGTSPRYLVASPDYVRAARRIRKPEDLSAHPFLLFAGLDRSAELTLKSPAGEMTASVTSRYRVNNSVLIRRSVEAGRGLAMLPAWLVSESIAAGRLTRVLPKWEGQSQDLHFVYPSRRYQVSRVRVLMQHIVERLPTLQGMTVAEDAPTWG